MGVEVQVEAKGGYVHARCRGTYALEDLLKAFERVLDAASREGLRNVLIDVLELEGSPPTTMERFELGTYVAQKSRGHRLAVVGRPPMVDPAKFGETVALNRGASGRVFDDGVEALAWLTGAGTESGPP